jgi:transaldolase
MIMKLFLDTANVEQIKEAASLGVLSGITTNPPIIAREGGYDVKSQIAKVLPLIDGEVIAQVVSLNAEGMIKQAQEIASWRENMVVKIPMCWEGLKAISELKKQGISTCTTVIFTPSQALLAANAGAKYVAPFMGRSRLICQDGLQLVKDIADIFKIHNMETQVLVGSVENPIDAIQCAKAGAHVATVPFKTLQQMAAHPNTDITIAEFLDGWDGIDIK